MNVSIDRSLQKPQARLLRVWICDSIGANQFFEMYVATNRVCHRIPQAPSHFPGLMGFGHLFFCALWECAQGHWLEP